MLQNINNWPPPSSFQALALAGGGYRGLFTARVLEQIENQIQEPIGRRFDLISGTSIGGLIALAIGFEVPMSQVVKIFQEEGTNIFPESRRSPQGWISKKWDYFSHRNKSRYSAEPLKVAIEKLIPKEKLLGDSKHALLIPAVNVTKGTLRIFKTPHSPHFFEDASRTACEVALATSAAPTYFPIAESKGEYFADGGMFANAPDMVVAHEADYVFNVPANQFKLLSIGTINAGFAIAKTTNKNFGILNWMDEGRLIDLAFGAQGDFVRQIMKHRFGDNYRLIDTHNINKNRELQLDDTSKSMTKFLMDCADEVTSIALKSGLEKFIAHNPTIWRNNG